MKNKIFNYQLNKDTVIFTDTLKRNSPYIAEMPRNHESIFFVTKGTLLYEKEDIRVIIEEGQIGYIARGSIDKSSAYLCDAVSYIAINFCFDKINTLPTKTLPFKTLCSQGIIYEYEKLFNEALNHYLSKSPGYIFLCNGIVMQIIGFLYNELKISIDSLHKMQRLEPAIQYLKKHYDRPAFKISDLATEVHLSEKHFRHLFHDVYHKTPYEFYRIFA